MFDIGWPELFIIAVVVLLVVGPKDLPKVLRTVGHLAGKAKRITQEFRTHVDDMVRESELDDVRKQMNEISEDSLEDLAGSSVALEEEFHDAINFDGEDYVSVAAPGQVLTKFASDLPRLGMDQSSAAAAE